MQFRRVRVLNYKSLFDSGWIGLDRGFNIIIGRNSAGKTSLLEALRFPANIPHRSPRTIPDEGGPAQGVSAVEFEILLTRSDLTRFLTRAGRQVHFPIPSNDCDPLDTFLQQQEVAIRGERKGNGEITAATSYGLTLGYEPKSLSPMPNYGAVTYTHTDGRFRKMGTTNIAHLDLLNLLAQSAFEDVYYFVAQRYNLARAPIDASTVLAPDGRNLATVLLNLIGNNPERFREYNALVSEVLPEIRAVTVAPDSQSPQSALIKIWYLEPKEKRGDLAIPLDQCGTGVSQVLAMLYVALTSISPRVIVIDEPQSFLHPGAARRLLEVLASVGSQHQYVLSTHWPGAMTTVSAQTLYSMRLEGMETRVRRVDLEENAEITGILLELGVRLSDVFGAEKVIWVEGPTEELFFPEIVEKILRRRLAGTQILGVLNTGDFERRHRVSRRTVWEIYSKLASGTTVVPPSIAFIFDHEGREPMEMEEASRDSGGRVRFLRRRMLENYLLDARAIGEVLREIHREDIDDASVSEFIKSHSRTPQVWDAVAKEMSSRAKADIESLHGARLLETLFTSLTEGRVSFTKTRDSVAIGRRLIESDPTSLEELSELLNEVLTQGPR